MQNKNIKNEVKEIYSKIATESTGCSCGNKYFSEDYTNVEGYNPDADLGLGCGIPTEFANIKEGDVVVDLGSGAGNDCFVARRIVGEKGKVIGIDFTDEMIEKARNNAEKLGYNNVEFREGDIEKMPISASIADVVVSNCVINLVPDKEKAYSEVFRIMKNGGHFSISDIVIYGELPDKIRSAAAMTAACISGAVSKEEYLRIVEQAGFRNITIQKERPVKVDDGELLQYIAQEDLDAFRNSGAGVGSINIYADKFVSCCCSK